MIPAMGLNTSVINDFSGGVNLVDDPVDLDPNELVFLQSGGTSNLSKNLEIIGKGEEIRPRRGTWDIPTSTPMPAAGFSSNNSISNMKTYRQSSISGDLIIMSTVDGDIYTANVGLNPGTVTSVFTSAGTQEWDFQQAQDSTNNQWVWMLNGSDPAKKMNMGGLVSAWAGTPPAGKILCEWKNRMMISGVAVQPQRLYYSDIANPESWPANNFIDIKSVDDEVDDILGLHVIGENLLVLKRNSVWVIFDPVSFDNRRIAPVGVLNRACITDWSDRVFWASPSGIYSTDGDTIVEEGVKIRPVLQNLGAWAAAHSKMITTHENTLMFIPWGNSNPWNGVWVCYLQLTRRDGQHPWVYHGGNSSRMIHTSAAVRVFNNIMNIFNGVGVPGIIGVYSDGVNQFLTAMFFSSPIDQASDMSTGIGVDMQYISPWLPLQGSENIERIRRLNIRGQGKPVTISVYKDGSLVSSFSKLVVTSPTDGLFRVRPETRGRFHQVRVSFNAVFSDNPTSLSIHGIELKYRGGKEH